MMNKTMNETSLNDIESMLQEVLKGQARIEKLIKKQRRKLEREIDYLHLDMNEYKEECIDNYLNDIACGVFEILGTINQINQDEE